MNSKKHHRGHRHTFWGSGEKSVIRKIFGSKEKRKIWHKIKHKKEKVLKLLKKIPKLFRSNSGEHDSMTRRPTPPATTPADTKTTITTTMKTTATPKLVQPALPYTFSDGRPVTVEPDAETIIPLI